MATALGTTAVYTGASRHCVDCGRLLPASSQFSPRRYCELCARLHRAITFLRQALQVVDGLDDVLETRIELAMDRAEEALDGH